MKLWKAHGLGNDYLVWEGDKGILTPSLVYDICDRHRGIGADGILEPLQSHRAQLGVRIWNPDGSTAEKSGNGLRIFAWWAHFRAGWPAKISIDTGDSVVFSQVLSTTEVVVEMGQARFEASEIPCTEEIWGCSSLVAGTRLRLWAAGMGNPHCVSFFEPGTDLDGLDWRIWGAELERDPRFPNRSNVQFAVIRDRQTIDIRIWERGAGETSASGSSSCAVAAVAHRLGLVDEQVTMVMPGGQLSVCLDASFNVQLQGPVEPIGECALGSQWCLGRS